MRNVFLIFLVIALCFSCNNRKKEKIAEVNKSKELLKNIKNSAKSTNHFQVDIEALVEKADNFQLFYTEDYMLSFSGDSKITTYVKDSIDYQIIRFNLEENIFPERYRFDIGANQNQDKIEINSISVRYENKEIVISRNYLDEYLIKNEYIEGQNGNYTLHTIEKNGEVTYDPFFLCSPKFIRLLYRL